jgi:hypothetical protein
LRLPTDARSSGRGHSEDVLAHDPQLATSMLITTCVGLTMIFSGVKKRRLRWRSEPRGRRRLRRRFGAHLSSGRRF